MKLIVDKPMPTNCCDCALDCCWVEGTMPFEYAEKRKPDCPIKGELVRCGDCRWWSKDEPDDEYGYCYDGKMIGTTKENWYCADGERKDGERRTDE